MKRSPILLILLTLNFSLSAITYGADRRGFNKKKLAKIGDKVQSLIDGKFIAGAVTLIARDGESDWGFGGRKGECGWGGAASTHFWISQKDGLIAITLRNFMPYEWTLEKELKTLIYDAMSD